MALYEQARQATPQPPQANAYALAIKQSRSTHLNKRLPCIGVLRFNAPAQRRLAKVANRSTPALGTEREEREFLSFFVCFFVFGESRPLVIVCVAVWLYTSKLAKPPPQPPQANAYALAIKQSRSTHLNKRLRGYDSDILLDLFKVCAIFLVVSARVCDLKVATLRPRLWVLRERNESFSLFLFVFLCLARADLWSLCVLRYGSIRASSPSHTTTPTG